MTVEILVGVLAGLIAILALGSAWSQMAHAANLMRMVAQTDERTKLYQREQSVLVNRFMAVLAPNNYASYREQSGLVEGAPLSTKAHYIDPAVIAEELDRKRREADAAANMMNRVKGQVNGAVAERTSQEPANTMLGFEKEGGP